MKKILLLLKSKKKEFLLLVFVVPLVTTFIGLLPLLLLIAISSGVNYGFVSGTIFLFGFISIFVTYPSVLIAGLPSVIIMELVRWNGWGSYLLAALVLGGLSATMAIMAMVSFLPLSEFGQNILLVTPVFGAIGGIGAGLSTHHIFHKFEAKKRFFRYS